MARVLDQSGLSSLQYQIRLHWDGYWDRSWQHNESRQCGVLSSKTHFLLLVGWIRQSRPLLLVGWIRQSRPLLLVGWIRQSRPLHLLGWAVLPRAGYA